MPAQLGCTGEVSAAPRNSRSADTLERSRHFRIGAVIRFRNCIWRVDLVVEREFWATPLDGRDGRQWRFVRSSDTMRSFVCVSCVKAVPAPYTEALS